MSVETAPRPWYREPWPWLIMSGPAVVVVASFVTLAIAIRTNDGLVAEDYYKQGLAINQVIEREGRARELGLAAAVQFNAARDRVRVLITAGTPPAHAPRLRFVNAARSGLDRTVALATVAPGVYEATVRMPAEGLWNLRLEDADAAWRLEGSWSEDSGAAQLTAPAR